MSKPKTYEFFLPVFKQGDDLHGHLQANPNDHAKALIGLAEQYEAAAGLCRRVAGVVAETPGVTLDGDTHMIWVYGPAEPLAGLVKDEVLTVPPYDEEEDEDPEGDDIDDEDETD